LKKLELKQRRALKATSSFASSSQIESEPQSPTSKFSSPDSAVIGKRLSSAVSNVALTNINLIPAKKRNIKADSAADALK
jgi:hypothetical protein